MDLHDHLPVAVAENELTVACLASVSLLSKARFKVIFETPFVKVFATVASYWRVH